VRRRVGVALPLRRAAALAAAMAVSASAACSHSGKSAVPATTAGPTTTTSTAVTHPHGGSARVGVSEEPDVSAPTLGGAAVRALVLPQLFVARPDGRWTPSLVAPGSDHLAADKRSASFRLRAGATWSDGTPITAEDLRRSADP